MRLGLTALGRKAQVTQTIQAQHQHSDMGCIYKSPAANHLKTLGNGRLKNFDVFAGVQLSGGALNRGVGQDEMKSVSELRRIDRQRR